MRRRRARPFSCAEKRAALARPSTRGSGARRCGSRAMRQRASSNGAHSAPSTSSRASGWMPTGVASTGTSQASASSTASPKPSRSEGTRTALAALIHRGTLDGVDAAQREQLDLDRARERERAVVALLRAGGVGCEQQVRPRGVEAQLGARLRSWQRAEALEIHAAGQHLRPAPCRAARQSPARAEPRRRREGRSSGSAARVARRVRGWRSRCRARSAPARAAGTARAGQAVRPKWAWTTSKRDGSPAGREAEAPAQVESGPCQRPPARRELVELDVELVRDGAARRPDRARSARARGGRRRGACWRPRARARSPDRSALE